MRNLQKISPFVDLDLKKPVDKAKVAAMAAAVSCFGKEWDMRSRECPVCAMNDFCGILFQDVVNEKAKGIESANVPFLDKTDFGALDKEELYQYCKERAGTLSINDFVVLIREKSKSVDEVALIEWLKRFKEEKGLKFRAGLIWLS